MNINLRVFEQQKKRPNKVNSSNENNASNEGNTSNQDNFSKEKE